MLKKYYKEQPIAIQTLENMLEKNTITHAYLFNTNNYSKSIELVVDFVKMLIIKDLEDENQIEKIIKMINNGTYLDLKVIESDGLWIKKNQMLDLQKEFSIKANPNHKKIYIIKNAERLNAHASNSILKFLEEPEPNIIAILLSDNSGELLDTIVSRCIQINLNSKQDHILKLDTTTEKITSLFFNNDNIKGAVELPDINIFIEDIFEIVNNFEKNDKSFYIPLTTTIKTAINDRKTLLIVFDIMILLYKDCINYLLYKDLEIFNDYKEKIIIITKTNSLNILITKINKIINLKNRIKNNVNLNLLMDKLTICIGDVKND